MMMKSVVVLLTITVALAKAQNCKDVAKQHSGLFSMVLGQASSGSTPVAMTLHGSMSTDMDKGRSGGSQEVTIGQYTVSQKFVTDFKEQISYVVSSGKCYKTPVPAFMDVKEGRYLGTFSYGSGKLIIESFEAKVKPSPAFNGTTTVYSALDAETCIPVTTVTTGDFTKEGKTTYQTTTFNYVNATSSIPDPNVFEIPAECK